MQFTALIITDTRVRLWRKALRLLITAIPLIFVLLTLHITPLHAEEVETVIEAEHLKYEVEGQLYHLKGNVLINREGATLEADRMDYSEKTGDAAASGNVKYSDKDVIIEAEESKLNMLTKKGTLTNTNILFRKDNYHIRADEVERIDENSYVIRKGTYTTCDGLFPAWCFNAGRTEIKVGDTLKAKDVTFRVKGAPLFYTPYLSAPIGKAKKTGLLWPKIGTRSDKGFSLSQPFYFAVAENRDITLLLDYYGKRGVGEGLEYRYIEKEAGSGELWLYHLWDRELEKNFFEVKGKHSLLNENGLSAFLKVNALSETAFYSEYKHRVEVRSSRFLESTGEIYHPMGNGRAFLRSRVLQDLDGQTGEVFQQVPGAGLSVYPVRKGPFYLSLDTSYSFFYTEDIQKAHRVDLYPIIYHSAGDAIQISQVLGLRETLYSISNSGDYTGRLNREAFDYNIRLHTRLTKNYSKVRHAIEPEIKYTFIPNVEDNYPLLDSTELYDDTSDLEVGLKSYLFDREGTFLTMRLSGTYDLNKGSRALSLIKYEAFLERPFDLEMDLSFDPYSLALESMNYTTAFNLYKVDLSLGQRYKRTDDILTYTGGIRIPFTNRFSVDSSAWYNGNGEGLREQSLNAVYTAQCWGLTLSYRKRPADHSFFMTFEMKGLGNFSL